MEIELRGNEAEREKRLNELEMREEGSSSKSRGFAIAVDCVQREEFFLHEPHDCFRVVLDSDCSRNLSMETNFI